MQQSQLVYPLKMTVWSLMFFVLIATSSVSQDLGKRNNQQNTPPVKAYSPERYISRSALTDSLTSLLMLMSRQQDSLRETLRNQKDRIQSIEESRDKLAEENKNLKSELNGAIGDNLQSSHTKSILFVFNVIIGVFLLIAMIWMFARKRSEPVTRFNSNSGSGNSPNVEGYDHKLERIEKLGNLREKGLLTDDEFNLQKKQILGDRG